MRTATALMLVVLGLLRVEAARAAEPATAAELGDRELDARLAFLEERLDERRQYAGWWWNGWTAFYATGVAVQATRAGLTDGDSKRADYVVSAVKAAGGVANLLRAPLQAKEGADPVRALPDATPEDRRRRLARAEALLRGNADEAAKRRSWLRHALNVGVNVAGALIVAEGFDDPSRGWRSAGIGIAVGEAMIWSQPWWPSDDWNEYQRRFASDGGVSRVSWRIVPTVGGAMLEARF